MRTLETLPFDNRYARLPAAFFARVFPTPLPSPYLVTFNADVARLIDLDPAEALRPEFLECLNGTRALAGAEPLATLYAGHQFGQWVPQLGDGRALLLGETRGPNGHFDLQLKGSGTTPFSRSGDGRAVLRSTIREYLCGEAMHGLGVPTTRALCIFGSDQSKVLATLDELKRKEFDKYVGFYHELGALIKEGAYQDYENKNKLADLLLFESTKTDPGKQTSLADYVERMSGEQTEIYYLAGDSREVMEQSPLLESFKAKSWEVLLLTDPADEFVVSGLFEYQGKQLKAVDKAGIDEGNIGDDKKKQFQPLLDFFKEKIADIGDARLTNRLKDSAVCLVSDENAMSASMERLMQRMQRDKPLPASKRILEVNPEHALVQAMEKLLEKDKSDARLEKYARLLYDQAVILEGSKVKDPLVFAQRLNELLLKDADR